ncbi:MAG: hypothetical protein RLZZ450_4781 [Pseudomonadota bacterium]|jgi:hypothetical protein
MNFTSTRWLALMGLVLASACSDGDGENISKGRASVLSLSAGQIATFALSDSPSADFVAARQRVKQQLPAERVTYARAFALGPTRGAAMVSDATFRQSRDAAAIALGTTIDQNKALNAATAQTTIDTLLAELIKVAPGATSCDALPAPKKDACAFALIIMEVLRSEGTTTDGGSVGADSGAPVGDATVGDAAVGDATVTPTDGGGGAPVNLFSCGVRDPAGAYLMGAYEPKSTSITAPETWSGKVHIKGATNVTGVTLTIMPGTEIFMDVDATLEIGWNNSEGAILAEGTPTAPIRFCGKSATAEKGYWGGITLGSNVTSNSVLRNVLISDGAGADNALELQADVTVDNVQIRNGEKDGVWATDFKEGSRALSVEGVGGSAVVFKGEGAISRFPLGGMLLNNTNNQAVVRVYDITKTATVHNLGIPYVQEDNLRVTGGEITFEAGVDYRFNPDRTLTVGWNSSTAGVHVNGTAAAPVKFSALQAITSQWAGILVETNVTTNSNLSYMEVRQGGTNTTPALELRSAVLVENVKLEDNVTGMEISDKGLATGSKNLTITKTKGRPLSIVPDGLFTLPQGSTFTGNDLDQIEVNGTTVNKSGTIADPGIPYYLTGVVRILGGANVVIAPGTDFVMGVDSEIDIGWNSGTTSFIAAGTAAAPITFVGITPTAGSWHGLYVEANVLSNSKLDYVQISHAGGPSSNPGGALELRVGIPVTNSKFLLYAGYGISKPSTITTDYAPTNTFDTTGLGPIGKP